MSNLNDFVSWDESLTSKEYKRSLTANLVLEATRRRLQLGLSQSDLADRMETTQSVISRFENLGRQPSIGFLERLARALDMKFAATLNGDFMYVAPYRMHGFLKTVAEESETSTREYLYSQLTGILDECARETWNVISKSEYDGKEEGKRTLNVESATAGRTSWTATRSPESLGANEDILRASGT